MDGPRGNMPSQIGQTEEDKYFMILHVEALKKKKNPLRYRERLAFAGGEEQEVGEMDEGGLQL